MIRRLVLICLLAAVVTILVRYLSLNQQPVGQDKKAAVEYKPINAASQISTQNSHDAKLTDQNTLDQEAQLAKQNTTQQDDQLSTIEQKEYKFQNYSSFKSYCFNNFNPKEVEKEENPDDEMLRKLFYYALSPHCSDWPERSPAIYKYKERGVKMLMQIIKDGEPYPGTGNHYVDSALGTLAHSKYSGLVDPLELYQLIKDKEDEWIRRRFAILFPSFVNKRNEESIHELAQLLQDKSEYVREFAVRGLSLVGSHVAIAYIEKLRSQKNNPYLTKEIELALNRIYINNMDREQRLRKLHSIAIGTDALQDEVSRTWAVAKLVKEGHLGVKELLREVADAKAKIKWYDTTYYACIEGIYKLGGELTEKEKKMLWYKHIIDEIK